MSTTRTPRSLGRPARALRRLVAIGTTAAVLAGLFTATEAAVAAPGALAGSGHPAGSYLVTLADAPASQYTGSTTGYRATKPAAGRQLDAASAAVSAYAAHLEKQQRQLARSVGAKVTQSFTLTLDAFSATLTAKQADALAALPGVELEAAGTVKTDAVDEAVSPAKQPAHVAGGLERAASAAAAGGKAEASVTTGKTTAGEPGSGTEGVDVDGGPWTGTDLRLPELWDQEFGGDYRQAGAGVVIGVIGSGIATEALALGGEPLTAGDASDAEPHLDGGQIVFHKADGGDFRGVCQTGTPGEDASSWSADDCSTKVIGARYFDAGFATTKLDLIDGDYRSPRDGSGIGTHSASVAAGGAHVPAKDSPSSESWGQFAGVAPGAKLASYKACWQPVLPVGDSLSGLCRNTDVIAAIEQAVRDGVDIIDLSGVPHYDSFFDPAFRPVDQALEGAAAAGVFASVPAGDDGTDTGFIAKLTFPHYVPDTQPFYALVGAAVTPGTRATVTSGGHLVEGDTTALTAPVTAPLIRGRDTRLNGYDPDAADRCASGSLSPASTAGKIVVCTLSWDWDPDVSLRAAAQEVKDVGGVGLVLILSEDDEGFAPISDRAVVPTIAVHTDDVAALLAQATTHASATIAPQTVADTGDRLSYFTEHGPVAGRSGVLAPDVLAPGTLYRGAWASTRTGDGFIPADGTLSGTSVAAAYVAGLAAVYLGVHPDASPMAVKSALMTTATPVTAFDGSPVDTPFAEGAGAVDPLRVLHPGFVYDSALADWTDYLHSQGLVSDGAADAQPWQLNQAAIVLDDTSGERTVTRTVTSTAAGHYAASFAPVAGLDIAVSPSTLDFTAAGQTAAYTVTVSGAPAAFQSYLSTRLVWTGDDGTVSALPLLYSAKSSTTPHFVAGTGVDGSVDYDITDGAGGLPQLTALGATPLLTFPNDGTAHDPSHSGGEHLRDGNVSRTEVFDVPAGVQLLHVSTTMFPIDQAGTFDPSLGFALVHVGDRLGPDSWGIQYGALYSDNDSAIQQQLDWVDPDPGQYVIFLWPQGEQDYDLSLATFDDHGAGALTATASRPIGSAPDATTSIHLAWSDLEARSSYAAAVRYGDAATPTVVHIATGAGRALSSTVAPRITGDAATDATLTVTPGSWSADGVDTTYQWSRNGTPIPGATEADYRVSPGDVGAALSATVTASKHGYQLASASSAPVTAHAAPLTALAAPTVTGTRAVGEVLTARGGTWNVTPSALSYQWKIDGAPVAGETAAAFTVPFEAAGEHVSVTVRAVRPGYRDGSADSATTAIAGLPVHNLVKPKISGKALVGSTLKVSAGVWDAKIPVAYRWLANGKAIAGATKPTLKVTAGLAGKKVSVVATAAGHGYATATAHSASVAVKSPAKVSLKLSLKASKTGKKLIATVKVSAGTSKASGTVSVKVGARTLKAKLTRGTARLVFPAPHARTKAVAKYAGSTVVAPASSPTVKTPAR